MGMSVRPASSMKSLMAVLAAPMIVGAALALACGAAEAPQAPAQPLPAAPAAPAIAAAAPAPQVQVQPQQPAPAAPAVAPRVEPVVPVAIAAPSRPPARPAPVPVKEERFGGVLKWVPQGSVGNLDSMTSGSAIGRGIMWHVWEQLMEWDDQGIIQPDMLDTWKIDDDGKRYTFTLRDGLNWHDGRPLTIEDVEASVTRWRNSDRAFGPVVNDLWVSWNKVDAKTFRIILKEPTGLLMMGLGYPGGVQPNIMPKEAAATPVGTLITNRIGTGPYKFVSWEPGHRVILDRYTPYKPRTEPPSYRAGAKLAYFDRLDMVEIPDQETRVAAVLTGEVDYLDVISGDFYERALKSDKVKVHIGRPGAQPSIHFNMGDPLLGLTEKGRKMRLAIQAAINSEDVMKGYGDPTLWNLCPSLWLCGTLWGEGDFTNGHYNMNNPELAKRLLKEAGYNGEPIILMDPADFPTIHPIPVVLRDQLKRVGINVEYKAMDWATQLQVWDKDAGWHIAPTWNSSNLYHPLVTAHTQHGTRPRFYPPDHELAKLKSQLARSVDQKEQKALSEKMSKIYWEDPSSVPFGQFFQLRVYHKDVMDVDIRGAPVGSPIFLNVWWSDLRRRAQKP